MNPKFMCVDDEPDTLNVLTAMLNALGCDVEAHGSGEAALAALADPQHAQQFDALFLDIMMPGLSGLAVLEQLRTMSHLAHLPVIFLTARTESKQVMEGYALGASYYITKPFTKEQLIYALDTLLAEDAEEAPEGERPIPVHSIDYTPADENDSGIMLTPSRDVSKEEP